MKNLRSTPSLRSVHGAVALALGLACAPLSVVACGSSSTGDDAAEPTTGTPATTPGPSGSSGGPAPAPSAHPDGDAGTSGDAAPAKATRAKCGQAPYDWIVSPALGDVFESNAMAPHTVVELNYALYKARKDDQMKTKRLAKHNTKSRLLRYQTQDRGKLVEATTLMAVPDVLSNSTFPILLVLHGTAGFNDQCSPSRGAAEDTFGGFMDNTAMLLSLFASLGYVAIAPDYIGLKSLGAPTGFMHPYLVAEPTAIASLDAVRAVKKELAASSLKITPGDLVVVGGSQGGHAADFVNRFQPHYAPDLPIKGSVWDVPPTNILGQAGPALTSWKNATKNTLALVTTYESWYGASPNGVSGALNAPYDKTVPNALATQCSFDNLLDSAATLNTVFNPAFVAAGAQPGFGGYNPWACYLSENSLQTTTVPKLDSIPSLMLLAEQDTLVDNTVERAAFQTLCSQGLDISFLECAGAGHTRALVYGLDQWFDFLEDRLAGKPVTGSCVLKPAEQCASAP